MRATLFRPSAGALVALASGLFWPGAAAADCTLLRGRFEAAQQARDLAAMKATADELAVAAGCEDAFRDWARGTVARALAQSVRAAVTGGAPLADQAPALEEALSYGPVWQAAAWLGDIAYDAGRYGEASRRYQEALGQIADERATPQAPPETVIAHLFGRAEVARLAADDYVAPPKTRAGEPSGLGSPSIRGFRPKKVAVPVEFRFGSTDFTERGLAAVRDLLASLNAGGTGPVTLVGHTDPVGGPEANMMLSQRRAAAVRDFLLGSGFKGQIAVEGRGESDPLKLPDAARFTTAQYHQMLRRVEVVR